MQSLPFCSMMRNSYIESLNELLDAGKQLSNYQTVLLDVTVCAPKLNRQYVKNKLKYWINMKNYLL